MSIAVVMPQLGLTMEEGTVSAWLKTTGDAVKKDELLFSVSTDKIEMDVESVAEGVLGEIIQPAGSTVRVGTILAYIEAPGEGTALAGKRGSAPDELQEGPTLRDGQVSIQPTATATGDGKDPGKVGTPGRQVSPRAKRLARDLGIDLAEVRASSPDGQITEADIRETAEQQKKSHSDVSIAGESTSRRPNG